MTFKVKVMKIMFLGKILAICVVNPTLFKGDWNGPFIPFLEVHQAALKADP